MRAYYRTGQRSGVSFGIVGAVFVALGYVLYLVVVGTVYLAGLAVVGIVRLCRHIRAKRALGKTPGQASAVVTPNGPKRHSW